MINKQGKRNCVCKGQKFEWNLSATNDSGKKSLDNDWLDSRQGN